MPLATETAVPILPSADLRRAEAFYRYLGFRVVGRGEGYLQLARGDIELHLYLAPGHDPLTNSAGCYLRVADPARLRDAWCTDGINCLDVPGSGPFGETLFALVDPDGNTLRYGLVE
ncbi:VOC family protein [Actinospica sp. MGRD01-02]|uniref:VOC family protein n=1 Tax=Actinospica acidithermotolerans TaxID=2828514 RepID=A0A941EI58_9ACTN|nr:VOC family protein [Actinospica acidithermotolerans]MBR7829539.1 VOC family protein [Actinospica acidithermotolerans]